MYVSWSTWKGCRLCRDLIERGVVCVVIYLKGVSSVSWSTWKGCRLYRDLLERGVVCVVIYLKEVPPVSWATWKGCRLCRELLKVFEMNIKNNFPESLIKSLTSTCDWHCKSSVKST